MEVKPGYKQTEVGVIPEAWDVKQLGEMAELTSSKRIFENDYVAFGVPFYRGKEISMLVEGETIDDVCYISEARFAGIKTKFGAPARGDILITAVGTLGNVYVVNTDEPFYFKDGNLIWLRGIKGVEPSFLGIQLRRAKNAILGGAIGTSQKALTIVVLRDLTVALPLFPEQCAIATALGDVDKLLGGLDRLIAKKRDLKQAAMQQLLTGQTRLPGSHGEWEEKQLGEAFTISAGKSKSAYVVEGGAYWVCDMGSVSTEGRLTVSKRSNFSGDFLKCGDLIMPKDDIGGGNIIGKVGYVDANSTYILGDHVYCLRALEGDARFLAYVINSHRVNTELRKKVIGSAQLGLGRKSVNEQKVQFPKKPEQTAIAEVLTEMDTELAALEQRREKTHAVKQAMMQELLTGRTRLI